MHLEMAVFHGPMVAKDWAHADGVDLASWRAALSGTEPWDVPLNDGVHGLAEGEAEGVFLRRMLVNFSGIAGYAIPNQNGGQNPVS